MSKKRRRPPASKRTSSDIRGEALVYGRNPIFELLKHRPDTIHIIFVEEKSVRLRELSAFSAVLKRFHIEIVGKSKFELDDLTNHGVHQGVAAVLWSEGALTLEKFLQSGEQKDRIIVVLDQLTDPHNLGAILRAAETSGAAGVIITRDRSSPITPVVRKVSAGASELVPICEVVNLGRALDELKRRGFWIIGTALSTTASSLFEADLPVPCALVFGSEERGLRRLTLEKCDVVIKIPMQGKLQSLNVSQAASVVLYELLRRKLTKRKKR